MALNIDNPTDEERIELEKFQNYKEFCDKLMCYFKLKNVQDGCNAMQAMWVHHRLRSVDITVNGLPVTLDILNLVISGDIEVAYLALDAMTPDDGTQAYHWLTADRIGEIKLELAKFLGWA